LGRLPLDSFIKTQVMLYYSRIQSDGINLLVKEAFNINKNIKSNGSLPNSNFAEILQDVFLIPRTALQNLWCNFSKLNLSTNDNLSLPWATEKFKKVELNKK
jgi:hypothetical protein